jgi:hypothetical protein
VSRNRLYTLVLALVLAGHTWLGWNLLLAEEESVTTPCIVKEVTGLPCPSCGTTRAILSLAHGQYTESVLTNPFAVVLAAGLMAFPIWIVVDLVRKNNSFFRFYNSVETVFAHHRWMALAGVAIVIANWAWNISKGL